MLEEKLCCGGAPILFCQVYRESKIRRRSVTVSSVEEFSLLPGEILYNCDSGRNPLMWDLVMIRGDRRSEGAKRMRVPTMWWLIQVNDEDGSHGFDANLGQQ